MFIDICKLIDTTQTTEKKIKNAKTLKLPVPSEQK